MRTSILLLLISFAGIRCTTSSPTETSTSNLESERTAILHTLNAETAAAFNRDYEAWQQHWVQTPDVTKSYLNFVDSTMTETVGWPAVSAFVRTYIEEHPEPAPLPEPLTDIEVRVYGTGAWVSYEMNDPNQGWKREYRLMEKADGVWRIAGMQTVIRPQK